MVTFRPMKYPASLRPAIPSSRALRGDAAEESDHRHRRLLRPRHDRPRSLCGRAGGALDSQSWAVNCMQLSLQETERKFINNLFTIPDRSSPGSRVGEREGNHAEDISAHKPGAF